MDSKMEQLKEGHKTIRNFQKTSKKKFEILQNPYFHNNYLLLIKYIFIL